MINQWPPQVGAVYNRDAFIKPVFKELGMAIFTAPDAPAFGLTFVRF